MFELRFNQVSCFIDTNQNISLIRSNEGLNSINGPNSHAANLSEGYDPGTYKCGHTQVTEELPVSKTTGWILMVKECSATEGVRLIQGCYRTGTMHRKAAHVTRHHGVTVLSQCCVEAFGHAAGRRGDHLDLHTHNHRRTRHVQYNPLAPIHVLLLSQALI